MEQTNSDINPIFIELECNEDRICIRGEADCAVSPLTFRSKPFDWPELNELYTSTKQLKLSEQW